MKWWLFWILMLIPSAAWADINYVTYAAGGATPCQGCGTVLSSGTVSSINFDWGGGNVLTSGRADGVSIHFTGYITVPGSGSQAITFYDRSDDGFVLKINGATVISNWREQGPAYYNGSGAITLSGGQTYSIDVWYYENGGGAVAQLFWNQGGSVALVPTSSYVTTMPNPKTFGDGGSALPAATITPAETAKISQTNSLGHNSIYLQTYGFNNSVTVDQHGDYNVIKGTNGSQSAVINGDYNTIVVTQGATLAAGHNNLLEMSVTGSSNNLTVNQQTSSNYAEVNVSNGGNSLTFTQSGNNGKSLFANIAGSSNIINTTQQDSGAHFLELTIPTNNNNVSVTQSGNAQKLFSLTINSPNVGVTVIQDNATTADSAAMVITCNSGPCTGYTYTKR